MNNTLPPAFIFIRMWVTNYGLSHLIRVPPMNDRAICLYTLGQKFCLDTPRTDSNLRRITENLLKFTREYGDILVCQYTLGQTLKNHPWGVRLLHGIAQCTLRGLTLRRYKSGQYECSYKESRVVDRIHGSFEHRLSVLNSI